MAKSINFEEARKKKLSEKTELSKEEIAALERNIAETFVLLIDIADEHDFNRDEFAIEYMSSFLKTISNIGSLDQFKKGEK